MRAIFTGLAFAVMVGCIGPGDDGDPGAIADTATPRAAADTVPTRPADGSFTSRLLQLHGTVFEEGPPYAIEGVCGMAFPTSAADPADRRLWLVGGKTGVDETDLIIAVVATSTRYMMDNGCESPPIFFGGEGALATHRDPAGDRTWSIHLGEPPTLRDPSNDTEIALREPYSVALARAHERSPGSGDGLNAMYWYNGTLTWRDLGEWRVFLEASWCDVPEPWRRVPCD